MVGPTGLLHGVWEKDLSFATGNLYDRARLIVCQLADSPWDRLDPVVGAGRHTITRIGSIQLNPPLGLRDFANPSR